MKVIVEKSAISNVVKRAAKVASPKSSIKILSHVGVRFDGDLCTITANDGVRTYSGSFRASGDPGECTLEADKLSRAISGMSDGNVEITEGQIKQGRSRLKLESLSYSDFPQPDYEEAEETGLTADALSDAVRIVQHAMATKDVRPMLNGIHLCDGYAVATDGHRMAVSEINYSGRAVIVPADSIKSLLDMSGVVRVSESQLMVESDEFRFTTGLIEAKYPEWNRVMPKQFSATASFSVPDMVSAIKTVQLGGDTARFEFFEDRVTISNDNAEAVCDCKCDGSAVTGFNMQYVIDALLSSGLSCATMEVGEGARGASLIDGRFTIMPVRI